MMRDFGSNMSFDVIDNMPYLDILHLNWCATCEAKASKLKGEGAQYVSSDAI